MNERFLEKLKETGISVYRLSEETGIPYTNLCKLKNCRQDINNCSAKDIYILSLYFGCRADELLNPISYLKSMHGTYRGCKYNWAGSETCDTLQVQTKEGHQEIARFGVQSDTKYYCTRVALTQALIDNYILERESEAILNENIYLNA